MFQIKNIDNLFSLSAHTLSGKDSKQVLYLNALLELLRVSAEHFDKKPFMALLRIYCSESLYM